MGGPALGAFPAGPTAWTLEILGGFFRHFGRGFLDNGRVFCLIFIAFQDRFVLAMDLLVAHRGPPATAETAAMISGPSMVTSPAPMVTTTSPGRTTAATRPATAEKSGM